MNVWMKKGIAALAFAPAFLLASTAPADETLAYDDGVPAGMYATAEGDVELVTFTPAHPCRVTAVRMRFVGVPAATDVYIWSDYAGGWPDMEGAPLFHASVEPVMDGWTEIAVPEGTVAVDPPANFYVGQVLAADGIHIGADGSEPEGPHRSKLRIGGEWAAASDADLMVRADVAYFDVVESPLFTDVTEEAGLEAVSPNRVAWGDYDGDGDDDLLVSGSTLLRNDGGTFTNVSVEAGVRGAEGEVVCGGQGAVWADYDNDGFLDFYSTSSGFVPLCEPGEDGDWYCNRFSDGAIPLPWRGRRNVHRCPGGRISLRLFADGGSRMGGLRQ
jgi:hypothetical protein